MTQYKYFSYLLNLRTAHGKKAITFSLSSHNCQLLFNRLKSRDKSRQMEQSLSQKATASKKTIKLHNSQLGLLPRYGTILQAPNGLITKTYMSK